MSQLSEVFKSWTTGPLQQQQMPFSQPNYQAPNRYYVDQQYPHGQAWQQTPQPQQPYQQAQPAYNYHSPAQHAAHLAGYHSSSGMPSPAPSYHSPVPQHAMPSPAPSYHSPVPQYATPTASYGYGPPPPQPPPAELPAEYIAELPAELPGNAQLADHGSTTTPSTSTEVSSSSFANLARDLWGADSKLEEEKVSIQDVLM
jgi:hypothetical protein